MELDKEVILGRGKLNEAGSFTKTGLITIILYGICDGSNRSDRRAAPFVKLSNVAVHAW